MNKLAVFATREGLQGDETSSGHVITSEDLFVALPSKLALFQWVKVYFGEKFAWVRVLDVGPHSENDSYFLNDPPIPLAQVGKSDIPGNVPKNHAGIDLADGVYDGLGIPREAGIVKVEWEFAVPRMIGNRLYLLCLSRYEVFTPMSVSAFTP